MTKFITASMAATKLDRVMRKANEKNDRFIVQKPGQAPVVIVGIQDFIRTFGPEPKVLKTIGEQSKHKGTNNLTMREIDAEIAVYRREKRLARC